MHGRPGARALHAGGLLVALGTAAWAAGEPFLFPSLGPTAYLLAVAPDAPESAPRRVVGGHAVGVVAGFAAYHLLAPGLVATQPPPALSLAGARLAVAGVASVALTTGGMLATDLRHAPACATTLIVSLGLLSAPLEAGIVLVSVVALVAVAAALERTLGEVERWTAAR